MSEKTKKNSSINFYKLYKKYKNEIFAHFFITTIWTVLLVFILDIISNIIEGEINNNYTSLLPIKIQKYFPDLTLNKFFLVGVILVFFYALANYFSNLLEEELKIKGGYYIKNFLLDKFRQLPFEEKQIKSKEINTLAEFDSGEIGYVWEHLPNHVYHCTLTVILVLFFRWEKFQKMNTGGIIFSVFWLTLISTISFFLINLIVKNEKKQKKELTKEWAIINKEIEKSNLIESMGLVTQYREKQRKVSQKNQNSLFAFSYIKSLNKTVPGEWLAKMFPYLLLLIAGSLSKARNILPMWIIFENFQEVFKCFWEYGDYVSSLSRVNDFLSLPEKDDNLQGKIVPENLLIKSIDFKDVSFKYQKNQEWIIKDYNRSFVRDEINQLLGENGIGKSTVIYLILGIIRPQKGRIIITSENNKIFDLKEVNRKHWRENNVAYASHDNLIEEGSTGQRQLANIDQMLKKKNKLIFIFDEADNALDKNKQAELQVKLKGLIKEKKIVIYTKH